MFDRILRRVRNAVRAGRYRFTIPHFVEKLEQEELVFADAERAILGGAIHRRFTGDPRGVRYEVTGRSTDGRPMAVVLRIEEDGIPLLITICSEGERMP